MTARADRRTASRVAAWFLLLALASIASSAHGQGSPLVVIRRGPIDDGLATRIEAALETRRSVLPLKPLPERGRSPEELANEQRVKAIGLALERARKHEEVAAWDDCVEVAAGQLGVATEVLATSGKLTLLRDLHIQIGACMRLAGQLSNAQPHFRTASLLDESPPQRGLHREEAELAHEHERSEILARAKGLVRIETNPPGAEVWLDGRRVDGVTPLSVNARLGNHFVTLRRFRYEPQTTQALLQPGSKVRFVLGHAERRTLRAQLGEVRDGVRKVSAHELDLASASWAGAQQLVRLSKPAGPSIAIRVALIDALTGRSVRTRTLPTAAGHDAVRENVCALLGDKCPDESGVNPHLIWPFAVVAAIGAAIAIGFIVDSQRDTVFCPMDGC